MTVLSNPRLARMPKSQQEWTNFVQELDKSLQFSVPEYGANFGQTQAEISAGVTPKNPEYQPGDVRRYGAVGNGSTDDYAAIRDAFSLSHVHPTIFQPLAYFVSQPLFIQRNGAVVHANRCVLITSQDITPLTIGPIGPGQFQFGCQIRGDLNVRHTGPVTTSPGILFRQCYEGWFEVSAQSFHTNLKFETSNAGFVYNTVKLGRVWDGKVYGIHLAPGPQGWVNENLFINGRYFAVTDGAEALIYCQNSGGVGVPNNNVFLKPSLELVSGRCDWAIRDDCHSNNYIQPRIEGTWGNAVDISDGAAASPVRPNIWFGAESRWNRVSGGYYQAVVFDEGRQNKYDTTARFVLGNLGAGGDGAYSGPSFQVVRDHPNTAGNPTVQVLSTYTSSGETQVFDVVTGRDGTSSYILKSSKAGSLVLKSGKVYECIQSHTSGASTEPGVGADWKDYWRLTDTTLGGAAWATSTSYTGRVEKFRIDTAGNIDVVGSIGDGTWNGQPLVLGNYRLWFDSSGNFRMKNGVPSSETDGSVIPSTAAPTDVIFLME